MSLPSYVVAGRANLLARGKLVFDLLLAATLYFSGAPLVFLLAPAIDLILLAPYLRYVKRRPALLTFGTLTITAILLALAPFAMQGIGLALWMLFPLVAAGAGFVLGRRRFLWQMAGIVTVILAAAIVQLVRLGEPVVLDLPALAVLAAATVASIWLTAWMEARALQPDASRQGILGEPLTIVRGVMIVPFTWAVGGIQADALRLELGDLKRIQNPRWVVLDLCPAGEVGRRDLSAVERAVEATTSTQCTIVLARLPVDAIGHLDIAQSVVGRVERFATVPQAVEAGLRRLGWTINAEQAQRVVTTI
jgi:hypothetical protein